MTPRPHFKCSVIGRSILNASFVSADPAFTSYATRTTSSITVVYRLRQNTAPQEMAKIFWTSDASQPSTSNASPVPTFMFIGIHERPIPLSTWLTKGTSLLSSASSRRFVSLTDSQKHCKWSTSHKADNIFSSVRNQAAIGLASLNDNVWACKMEDSGDAKDTLLSLLLPPGQGMKNGELLMYGRDSSLFDEVVLSSILVCSRPDEWALVSPKTSGHVSRPQRPQSANAANQRVSTTRHIGAQQSRPVRTNRMDDTNLSSPRYGSWFHDPNAPPPPYDSMSPIHPPL